MALKTPIYADHPFKLVPIPGLGTPPKDLPIALFIAQDMACAHNGLLRTLNSIYLQAPHITIQKDIRDFLLYTKFWCGWIEEHHTLEESSLFPQLEELSGVVGLMEANVAQHNAFMSGLLALEKYAKETSVEDYDGSKIVKIIDDFGHVFSEHLTDEIQTLLELEQYDAAKLKEIYDNFEIQLRNGDKSILYPIVMGSGDNSIITWPLVPPPVRYLVHYIFEWKYAGAWRFNPSTSWGDKRPLAFTGKN